MDRVAVRRRVDVEHGAERVRRLEEAVLVEVCPSLLVERDRLEPGIRSGGGAVVERDARVEGALAELHVAHPQIRLLAVARPGVRGDEIGEVAHRVRAALVRLQHSGVEQHRVEVREVAVFLQDRSGRAGAPRPGLSTGGAADGLALGLRLHVHRHLLAELLARVDQQQVGETEAHLAARGRLRMPIEEPAQRVDRGPAPRRGLGIVEVGRANGRVVPRLGGRHASARIAGGEAHAERVRRDGGAVVDRLALRVECGDRALDGLTGDARAQRVVRDGDRVGRLRQRRGALLQPVEPGSWPRRRGSSRSRP